MSPRQISAYVQLAAIRRKGERAERLAIGAMAARGEPKEVEKRLKEWGGE